MDQMLDNLWVNYGPFCSRPRIVRQAYRLSLYSRKKMKYLRGMRRTDFAKEMIDPVHVLVQDHVHVDVLAHALVIAIDVVVVHLEDLRVVVARKER